MRFLAHLTLCSFVALASYFLIHFHHPLICLILDIGTFICYLAYWCAIDVIDIGDIIEFIGNMLWLEIIFGFFDN